jgi:NADPH:quinone reductase-like Zn-dependent oxidoreductase
VIVTSSSPAKLARARQLSADATFDHNADNVVAGVKEMSGGGAHVVVEHVGEATWRRSFDAGRTDSRICVCGAATGPNPPANLHRIWWKQLTVYGSTMGSKEDFESVYELVTSGRVSPVVDTVFPLEQAAPTHTRLESGDQLGKLVLRIPR